MKEEKKNKNKKEAKVADVTPEMSVALVGVDYAKMTVPELKNVCRKGNMSLSGNKAELLDRVRNPPHLAAFTPPSEGACSYEWDPSSPKTVSEIRSLMLSWCHERLLFPSSSHLTFLWHRRASSSSTQSPGARPAAAAWARSSRTARASAGTPSRTLGRRASAGCTPSGTFSQDRQQASKGRVAIGERD